MDHQPGQGDIPYTDDVIRLARERQARRDGWSPPRIVGVRYPFTPEQEARVNELIDARIAALGISTVILKDGE